MPGLSATRGEKLLAQVRRGPAFGEFRSTLVRSRRGVVGFAVRSHEETALRAATGDHVAATRDDGARKRHARLSATEVEKLLAQVRRGPAFGEFRWNLGEVSQTFGESYLVSSGQPW